MIRTADAPFKGRDVLVTGHTGFKGSWLTLMLHRLGARVTGYALAPPTSPSLFTAGKLHELMHRHEEADIRDGERLTNFVHSAQPDLIFHLAAQPLVRQSYEDPVSTFDVNVLGVARLLESVRTLDRPCTVIVATSDKCYENDGSRRRFRESDRLGGHDPYSASKAAAEIVVASYRRSFFPADRIDEHGVKLATVRAGNVIGGGDWASDRILPDAVRAALAGQTLAVRSPAAQRPWQHVIDALDGYCRLAATLSVRDEAHLCSGWNFGPVVADDLNVGELVEVFFDSWGRGAWRDESQASQPHEAPCLSLDAEKARRELVWRPSWDAVQAARLTARWYKQFYENPTVEAVRAACARDLVEHASASLEILQ